MSELEIARYSTRVEAEMLIMRLEAAGIASRLVGDDCGGVDPALSFTNGCRVLVDADDAERAREVEATPPSSEILGFTIGLERPVDFETLRRALSDAFPGTTVASVDPITDVFPDAQIALQVQAHDSEFKTAVTFWNMPQVTRRSEDIEPALAALLARRLGGCAICDGSDRAPRRPDSPYWALITDGETFWLADDRDTAWADGDGGKVRRVETIELDLPLLAARPTARPGETP